MFMLLSAHKRCNICTLYTPMYEVYIGFMLSPSENMILVINLPPGTLGLMEGHFQGKKASKRGSLRPFSEFLLVFVHFHTAIQKVYSVGVL